MSAPGRTCLLVGAGGFLGTHLQPAIEAAGLQLAVTSRAGGSGAPPCDLRDPASVARCLEEVSPKLIVNAAGDPSVARSWEQPEQAFAVNAAGVQNLLEAAGRLVPGAHVLCLSSAAVYGQPGPEAMPLREDSPVAPVSPYGEAKLAMEGFCREAEAAGRARVAVVRAFNLVGPGQPPFNAASALARQIAEAERDGDPAVELALGNPGAARDLIDVRDAARALLALSTAEATGTYNLCSGEARSVAELAAALAELTPLAVSTRTDPALARPSDPPLLLGDPRRLRERTGFEPAIPLSRSLADLLEHWRTNLGNGSQYPPADG
ncbi:MAG TPA: NAD-dependent epimerase/dehydratase family protein [Solirubrobacterales bacterium]|nr:NAD-dependent epimerase/dehydratase family protein [Solirubrobacterales bacterium]